VVKTAEIIYCAGNDSVFSFIENVLDEVMALFPSRYVHLGGDEAAKTHWKNCPLCQHRIQTENLANEGGITRILHGTGKPLRTQQRKNRDGLGRAYQQQASRGGRNYGWRGDGEAALKAAESGHPFILTPARTLYLIRYQGPQWFEPLTYFGNNTLKDVYQYEPVKDKWKPGYSQLLQGIQGSLWTEFCSTPQDVEYLIYPRLAALAEVAWSEKGKKDWTGFLSRLDRLNLHLSHKGIEYARSMYNIDHKVLPRNGELEVSLSCIRPDLEIRYTTNGDAPDGRSALYSTPLTIAGNCNLKAATFNGSEQKGEVLTLPVRFNMATAKPATGENINTRLLTNGLRGSDRHTDGEWCGWYAQDGSFVADLGERQKITRVSLGSLNNFGMGVHPPRYVKLYLSDNGRATTRWPPSNAHRRKTLQRVLKP
jgi:N-acetyl-beta-hexosaminidase